MVFLTAFEGIPQVYGLQENTMLFFLLMTFLGLLGLIKIIDPVYFSELFRSVIDLNYIRLMKREGKLRWNIVNTFLDLVFVGSIAFYIYQFETLAVHHMAFWQVFLWVTGANIVHLLINVLLGSLFFGATNIGLFLNNIVIFNRVIGIVFLPVVFLITYFELLSKPVASIMVGGLIIILLTYRILQLLYQMESTLKHGIIYNFLYLCIAEIAPLIVVIELIAGVF